MTQSRREWEFPWIEAIPGVLLGLGLGLFLAFVQGQAFLRVTRAPIPYPDSWTYHYTPLSIFLMVIIGGAVVTLGFFWHCNRQFGNYFIIGIGLGGLLGAANFTLEKVDVTSEIVVHRNWWGLSRFELRFAELRQLKTVKKISWTRRRGQHYQASLHYQLHNDNEDMHWHSGPGSRLFFEASKHLIHAASKHGVEITQEIAKEN